MRTATVTVDAERVSPSTALAALARLSARDGGPLIVVTHRTFGELERELGDAGVAVRHLLRVATNAGKPIAVNLPTGPDRSTTVFIGPPSWSDDRVAGWIGGHREALEAAFGAATPVRVEGGERDE